MFLRQSTYVFGLVSCSNPTVFGNYNRFFARVPHVHGVQLLSEVFCLSSECVGSSVFAETHFCLVRRMFRSHDSSGFRSVPSATPLMSPACCVCRNGSMLVQHMYCFLDCLGFQNVPSSATHTCPEKCFVKSTCLRRSAHVLFHRTLGVSKLFFYHAPSCARSVVCWRYGFRLV